MARVTAFLRVSVISAVLAATLLASQAASRPASAANQTSQSHAGGGRPGDKPAAPANAAETQPAATVAGCLKPGVPLCMDDPSTFFSADRMSSCQGEVKDYVDKSMAYLTCLNDENMATGRELGRNVERFNCRLSGRKGCAN
ncbi:hypothetical protein ABMY26_23025 [Azospirillum sp. HJ39]|uniref:hypothetical protein n=1 Tax=Azospirillum sp. HJ39 TaxID=3159496 RepID=UPI003556F997